MRETFSEKLFGFMNSLLLLMFCCTIIVPFIYIFSTSITAEQVVTREGMVFIPEGINISAYKYALLEGAGIYKAFGVSVFITVVGTLASLSLSTGMAYGLSKKKLPGRSIFMFLLVFSMLFSGGLIPSYMVVKATGLINSIWSMIIPSLVASYNTIILISFFQSLPESLEESARLDGANDMVIFFRIVLPLSTPVLATIALFYAVSYWNQWFAAVMYINDKNLYPLQVVLRQIVSASENSLLSESASYVPPSISLKSALIIITIMPITLTYPFLQKYFTKGILLGSVKG